jgi:hypothetical protein
MISPRGEGASQHWLVLSRKRRIVTDTDARAQAREARCFQSRVEKFQRIKLSAAREGGGNKIIFTSQPLLLKFAAAQDG